MLLWCLLFFFFHISLQNKFIFMNSLSCGTKRRENGVLIPFFINLDDTWRWDVGFTLRLPHLRENGDIWPLNIMVYGRQEPVWTLWRRDRFLVPVGNGTNITGHGARMPELKTAFRSYYGLDIRGRTLLLLRTARVSSTCRSDRTWGRQSLLSKWIWKCSCCRENDAGVKLTNQFFFISEFKDACSYTFAVCGSSCL